MQLNKITIIGKLADNPERTNSGVNFPIQTQFSRKDDNELQTHDVRTSGKLADIIEKYVKKNSKLYVEGRLQYAGNVKNKTTWIEAEQIIMLGHKQK